MSALSVVVLASSAVGVIVISLVTVALTRFQNADIEMGAAEFFKRMVRLAGYGNLGPAALYRRLDQLQHEMVLVDLRSTRAYAQRHIDGAVHRQFDDFLKAVVVAGWLDDKRQREIILICDTGHMSRVAADIMVEDEGFQRVFSLRGGMKRWQRWEAAQERRAAGCCGIGSLPACGC